MVSVGSSPPCGFHDESGSMGNVQRVAPIRARCTSNCHNGRNRDSQCGVQITAKQQNLKEQHASGPHRRTSAKPRQNGLADDRLDLKYKKRTQQYGQAIQP